MESNWESRLSAPFNPLNYPIVWQRPQRLTDIWSWHEHIVFAFALIQMVGPKIFVELGTHKGDSYCAFCQAVDVLGINTACYAVDTWQGDQQAGRYDEAVFEELKSYHDPRYGRFSSLLRCTFDEALDSFADGSIDLLHLDGLHTYERVKHDFQSWLPKMSSHGVMLIHDTNARQPGFGVWRLWEELRDRFPSFEFKNGSGLGVLAVGENAPPQLLTLFGNKEDAKAFSDFFVRLGGMISLLHRRGLQLAQIETVCDSLRRHVANLEEAVEHYKGRVADLEKHSENLQEACNHYKRQAEESADLAALVEKKREAEIASLEAQAAASNLVADSYRRKRLMRLEDGVARIVKASASALTRSRG